MTEALGVAASVAGLLGLSGQILQGCLFIKDFLTAAKNAPRELRDLVTELQALHDSVKQIQTVFEQADRSCPRIDVKNYETALNQCGQVISELRIRVTADSNKVGAAGSRLKWWYKLSVASRQKTLKDLLDKLGRAKAHVNLVQSNLTLSSQNDLHEFSRTMKEDVLAGQVASESVIVRELNTQNDKQTTAMGILAERLDQRHTELASEILKHLNRSGQTNTADSFSKDTIIEEIMEPFSQMFVLKLEDCIDRKFSTLTHVNQAMPRLVKNSTTGAVGGDAVVLSGSSEGQSSMKQHNAITRFKRYSSRQVLVETRYRCFLLDIDVKTTLSTTKTASNSANVLESTDEQEEQTTSYHFRMKLPFWRRGLFIISGRTAPKYGWNLNTQIVPYNIVPDDAPIFTAARDLDITSMRKLFAAGLASPRDRNEWGQSVLDRVVGRYLIPERYPGNERHEDSRVYELVKLLASVQPSDHRLTLGWLLSFYPIDIQKKPLLVETMKLYIDNCLTNPLERIAGVKFNLLGYENLKLFQQEGLPLEVPDALLPDSDSGYRHGYPGVYCENDRQMLLDPTGSKMTIAVESGMSYCAIMREYLKWIEPSQTSACSSLLQLYGHTKNDDVRACCLTRLKIFFDHGTAPDELEDSGVFDSYYSYSEDVTLVEIARHLGLEPVLVHALSLSGWTASAIQGVLDQDTYLKVPELMDGALDFVGVEEERARFIHELCYFARLPVVGEPRSARRQAFNRSIGLSNSDSLIRQARTAILARATPGTWPEDSRTTLIPGIDFDLVPYWHRSNDTWNWEHMAQWPCIRQLLEEEGYYITTWYSDEIKVTGDQELDNFEKDLEFNYKVWRRE